MHIAILKPRIKQRQSSGRSLSSVSPGLTIHQRARDFGIIFSISSTESLGARESEGSSEELCGARGVHGPAVRPDHHAGKIFSNHLIPTSWRASGCKTFYQNRGDRDFMTPASSRPPVSKHAVSALRPPASKNLARATTKTRPNCRPYPSGTHVSAGAAAGVDDAPPEPLPGSPFDALAALSPGADGDESCCGSRAARAAGVRSWDSDAPSSAVGRSRALLPAEPDMLLGGSSDWPRTHHPGSFCAQNSRVLGAADPQ